MKEWFDRVIINLVGAIDVALGTYLFFIILALLFPFMGYAGDPLLRGLTAIGVLIFFYLTREFSLIPTGISLILASLVWIQEITTVLKEFDRVKNTLMWPGVLPILGALLAINKLVIDAIFLKLGLSTQESQLKRILKKRKDNSQHSADR
jgi:hypothetical protein